MKAKCQTSYFIIRPFVTTCSGWRTPFSCLWLLRQIPISLSKTLPYLGIETATVVIVHLLSKHTINSTRRRYRRVNFITHAAPTTRVLLPLILSFICHRTMCTACSEHIIPTSKRESKILSLPTRVLQIRYRVVRLFLSVQDWRSFFTLSDGEHRAVRAICVI